MRINPKIPDPAEQSAKPQDLLPCPFCGEYLEALASPRLGRLTLARHPGSNAPEILPKPCPLTGALLDATHWNRRSPAVPFQSRPDKLSIEDVLVEIEARIAQQGRGNTARRYYCNGLDDLAAWIESKAQEDPPTASVSADVACGGDEGATGERWRRDPHRPAPRDEETLAPADA